MSLLREIAAADVNCARIHGVVRVGHKSSARRVHVVVTARDHLQAEREVALPLVRSSETVFQVAEVVERVPLGISPRLKVVATVSQTAEPETVVLGHEVMQLVLRVIHSRRDAIAEPGIREVVRSEVRSHAVRQLLVVLYQLAVEVLAVEPAVVARLGVGRIAPRCGIAEQRAADPAKAVVVVRRQRDVVLHEAEAGFDRQRGGRDIIEVRADVVALELVVRQRAKRILRAEGKVVAVIQAAAARAIRELPVCAAAERIDALERVVTNQGV